MSIVVPSGKEICFDYSFYSGSPGMPVAMKIYDLSLGPGLEVLVATVAMYHVFNGTYWGTYTFSGTDAQKNFLIQKSVYTDGTFATVDGTYSPGSEIVEVDGFDNSTGRVA